MFLNRQKSSVWLRLLAFSTKILKFSGENCNREPGLASCRPILGHLAFWDHGHLPQLEQANFWPNTRTNRQFGSGNQGTYHQIRQPIQLFVPLLDGLSWRPHRTKIGRVHQPLDFACDLLSPTTSIGNRPKIYGRFWVALPSPTRLDSWAGGRKASTQQRKNALFWNSVSAEQKINGINVVKKTTFLNFFSQSIAQKPNFYNFLAGNCFLEAFNNLKIKKISLKFFFVNFITKKILRFFAYFLISALT